MNAEIHCQILVAVIAESAISPLHFERPFGDPKYFVSEHTKLQMGILLAERIDSLPRENSFDVRESITQRD